MRHALRDEAFDEEMACDLFHGVRPAGEKHRVWNEAPPPTMPRR
jgi:hypothetical protein